MRVSLTFDNGPDAQATPGVLDTLADYGVRATFFLLGKNLESTQQRALAERAFAAGHHLGNHSYSHSTPFGELQYPQEAIDEVCRTDALLGDMVGAERLFRPFGRGVVGPHLLNRAAWELLVEMRFTCVLWNCLVREHIIGESWVETALALCERQEWSVVVLHDISLTPAMQQLATFLTQLRERNAQFTQEFPDDCTPLRAGVLCGPWERVVAPK
jgi:peptidoglycan-N-acetylglucosamine deacetylase